MEALEERNAALLERVGGLEETHRKQMEAFEAIHRRELEAVKAENTALHKRIAALESEERKRTDVLERTENFPLPPLGLGILGFLKQRNDVVEITVSSNHYGSTDNLLTEDNNYWMSRNLPNSWIKWTITGGLKAIISSVKIRGLPSACGVKDFIIEGSNDGAIWTTILDSNTWPTTFENFVAQTEELPQPQRPFSIIRLTQTGPKYCPSSSSPGHHLSLTYVDFGGEIVFPATAK
jgi:hypothetical protein